MGYFTLGMCSAPVDLTADGYPLQRTREEDLVVASATAIIFRWPGSSLHGDEVDGCDVYYFFYADPFTLC